MAKVIKLAPDPTFDNLQWYSQWVRRHVCSQPSRLLLYLLDGELEEDLSWTTHLLPLWDKFRELTLLHGPASIDSITDALIAQGIITLKEDYKAVQSARDPVFSILGWQTMLYKPDFASLLRCRIQYCRWHERIPQGRANLLEPVFSIKVFHPKDLEVYMLTKVYGVRFQWVDSLSCHLELDRPSDTLYVFRHSSSCVLSLQYHRGGAWPEDHASSLRARLEERDRFLSQVCFLPQIHFPVTLIGREEYDLAADFPRLQSKIVCLHKLWLDNRISTVWVSFWSVLIFGSLSLVRYIDGHAQD
ncbi:hypothetical protein F5X99DRAFT_432063 [Biscogniauxia marginata]|nr:hypothetical protein F5X99DRAFT_432063 [Biscogniauxia marginata]